MFFVRCELIQFLRMGCLRVGKGIIVRDDINLSCLVTTVVVYMYCTVDYIVFRIMRAYGVFR